MQPLYVGLFLKKQVCDLLGATQNWGFPAVLSELLKLVCYCGLRLTRNLRLEWGI